MNFYGILLSIHVLGVVVWVGGIFFLLWIFFPSIRGENSPELLIQKVLNRFFPWVWVSSLTVLITGWVMKFLLLFQGQSLSWSVLLMLVLGHVMFLIFLHIYFSQRKRREDISAFMKKLKKNRPYVLTNLVLGIILILSGILSRYYPLHLF